MSKDDSQFQLRTYIFIDQMQPQLAQFIAKDNRVYDPNEYDAAIMLELAPAMEIHHMIDQALKSTSVRLGSVVTERRYGLMQIQHPDQGEVLAAGQGRLGDDGVVRPLAVKQGDRVLFGWYAGTEIKVDGEARLVLREKEIFGIIES